ncbi:metallopeptidase [Candidatus Pacearchaeota archaeon]|nr:metallopeptidase [Candidatus Pacearchaeota archaeon]
MKYIDAPDLQERMVEIVKTLEMEHIDLSRVKCLRSFGSSTKRTIARCHTMGKLMQKAMGVSAFYAIEFLERFERMSKVDQDKVIIHELMHIPKTFGGGFRQHDFVCEENIEVFHREYLKRKQKQDIFVSPEPKKFPFWKF